MQHRPFHRTSTTHTFTFQLFHQDVSERKPRNADDLAPTNEDLMDELNGKNKNLMPKKAPGPGLHIAARFSDVHDPIASLLSVILTAVVHACDMRYSEGQTFL